MDRLSKIVSQVTDQTPTWQTSVWLDYLIGKLQDDGFSVAAFDPSDPENDATLGSAILFMTHPKVCQLARRQFNNDKTLVLITDDLEANFEYADFVFPPVHAHIRRQIYNLYALSQENQQLRADGAALEDRMKRQQVEMEILKNAIVRNVSHELKTPLLQVKSAVSLMTEDSDNTELSSYAKNAMSRLEALVKNITLLGSSLDVNPGPVIVRDAVEYAKRNLGRVWQHQDEIQRIHTSFDRHLPPALADKQGLSTVLQLLLDNALKFSNDTVEVIAKSVPDGRIYIAVKDSGIGIRQENIESIFDIFFQVDGSSTRRYGGTGIGLAIVRLILDHHQTQIHVQSEVGVGSTFSFTLPLVTF